MKHLANILAFVVGLSIAGGAFAFAETSPERYAEPYPHKPDQDTGTPRMGPASDFIAGPGSAAAVEKLSAKMSQQDQEQGLLPEAPRETGG